MYIIKEQDGSETYTGERLKFYYEEHREYWQEYAKDMTKEEAGKMCKKLARHFKVRVQLFFWNKKGGSYSHRYLGGGSIMMPQKPDWGILCHEMAHAIHYQRYHKHGHTKMLKRIMARVVAYCKKHDYWQKQEPSSIFDFLDGEWGLVAHAVE